MNAPHRRPRARSARILAALVLISVLSRPSGAQQSDLLASASLEGATRADLQRVIARAESLSALPGTSVSERNQLNSSAARAKSRLEIGDFDVGDRIAIYVQDQPTLCDTFAIRTGRHLLLPNMEELDLTGVLRTELQDHLRNRISQYLREPVVRATPLVRLSVLGSVVHPGYYVLAADLPVAELIMRAGGPNPDGDLAKVQLRRAGAVLSSSTEAGPEIAGGGTIDQLSLRSGDEVFVGERRRVGAISMIQVVSGLAGVAGALFAMQNSRHR